MIQFLLKSGKICIILAFAMNLPWQFFDTPGWPPIDAPSNVRTNELSGYASRPVVDGWRMQGEGD